MSYPTNFASLAAGNQPLSDFDTMFNIVGQMGAIPCTASGTNAITLTTNTNYYAPAAYTNGQMVSFLATSTSTGSVTMQINGLGFVNAYGPNGSQLGANNIANGTHYVVQYWSDLNSGSGGFLVISNSTTNSTVGSANLTQTALSADALVNLQITATATSSSILTISLVGASGGALSATNPALISFRDSTVANGDPVLVTLATAPSISTIVGATFGTQSSSIPFRLWLVALNNAGTIVLGLWHSGAGSAAIAINPLNESNVVSTVAITTSTSTSAGVIYTPVSTTLSNVAFRILGHLDYGSGLTTAGTYASAPTSITLFGDGIKKPGDIVSVAYTAGTSLTATLSSVINPFEVMGGDTVGATGTTAQFTSLTLKLEYGSTVLDQAVVNFTVTTNQTWALAQKGLYSLAIATSVTPAFSLAVVPGPDLTSITSANPYIVVREFKG